MPYYSSLYSLPKDIGASDWQDSCRLAGLMAMINHPKAPNMRYYVKHLLGVGAVGVRCPIEPPADNPNNFSRDQLMLLVAGLHAQKKFYLAECLYDAAKARGYRAQNTEHDYPGTTKKFPDGPDILFPSAVNHLKLASQLSGSFLGYVNLTLDILINAAFTPTREPNQLIAMCVVAGPKWVAFYKKVTPKWRTAIREYWSGWRGEPEIAEMFIQFLEK